MAECTFGQFDPAGQASLRHGQLHRHSPALPQSSNRKPRGKATPGQIMVETFAIKGFCYVMLPLQSTNKQKKLDRETIVIKCFKLSGDFTLLYIQVCCTDFSQYLPRYLLFHLFNSSRLIVSLEDYLGCRLFLCNPWVSNNGTSNSPIPPPQVSVYLDF